MIDHPGRRRLLRVVLLGEGLTLKTPRTVLALYSLGTPAEKANMQPLADMEG